MYDVFMSLFNCTHKMFKHFIFGNSDTQKWESIEYVVKHLSKKSAKLYSAQWLTAHLY
mgnify:CR=1 FL=1